MEDPIDMTATDIFTFDVKLARVNYLINKRKRGQPVSRCPSVPPEGAQDGDEVSMFHKRQAE